jgi:hypothetical protein
VSFHSLSAWHFFGSTPRDRHFCESRGCFTPFSTIAFTLSFTLDFYSLFYSGSCDLNHFLDSAYMHVGCEFFLNNMHDRKASGTACALSKFDHCLQSKASTIAMFSRRNTNSLVCSGVILSRTLSMTLRDSFPRLGIPSVPDREITWTESKTPFAQLKTSFYVSWPTKFSGISRITHDPRI